MLKSLTWQEFFLVIGLLAGLYYAIILLILSRSKRTDLLKVPTNEVSGPDVMGSINEGDGQNDPTIDPERIYFARTPQHDTTSTESVDPLILGSVSDLLEEAKTLMRFIIENKSSNEEATAFLRTLLSKYAHLKDSRYQSAIELYLFNELNNHEDQKLTLNEISALWV
jgi:hypothetical protein